MKPKLLAMGTGATMAVAVVAMVWTQTLRNQESVLVSDEDERTAADRILAERLSGPRYFHGSADSTRGEGGYWISPYEARFQIPRIAAERKLGPEGARTMEHLVDQMIEPHPSRAVGGTRINLLRLNLSLDGIK